MNSLVSNNIVKRMLIRYAVLNKWLFCLPFIAINVECKKSVGIKNTPICWALAKNSAKLLVSKDWLANKSPWHKVQNAMLRE